MRVSVSLDFTLILAWSSEEAGRYLETFKSYENKSADLISEKVGNTSFEIVNFKSSYMLMWVYFFSSKMQLQLFDL
jgi:hypothetical protein